MGSSRQGIGTLGLWFRSANATSVQSLQIKVGKKRCQVIFSLQVSRNRLLANFLSPLVMAVMLEEAAQVTNAGTILQPLVGISVETLMSK